MTNYDVHFSYQNKSYDIGLQATDASSDKAVTVGGKTYKILGSEEAVLSFKSHLEKLGTAEFKNFDMLEISLKDIGSQEGSKQEKIDTVFQKTIEQSTGELKTNSKSILFEDENGQKMDMQQTIKKIGEALEKYYIFPDIAKECSKYLQLQLEKGAYDAISDPRTFVDAVTKDLREISKDKHMVFDLKEGSVTTEQTEETKKAVPVPEERYPIPDLVGSDEYASKDFKGFPYEVKSGRLKDDTNIGYLDLRTCGICKTGDGDDAEVKKESIGRRAAFIEAVNNLKEAKSIIIDLRNNGGGVPSAVQLLCSLFMEEGSHLDSIHCREGDSFTITTWDTLPYEELPKEMRLLEQKVVVLISPKTFSAAESIANSMQALGSATIVGERSGGGANPGGYESIGKDIEIRIPSGRAINPNREDEGNWEGVGIIPDHEVSATDAVDTAKSILKTAPSLDPQTIAGCVQYIVQAMRDKYTSIEKGNECADLLLKKLQEGSYNRIKDPAIFAKLITKDLYKITKDKHIRVDLPIVPQELVEMPNTLPDEVFKDYHPDLVQDSVKMYKAPTDVGWMGEFDMPHEFQSGFLKDNPDIGYLEVMKFGVCNDQQSHLSRYQLTASADLTDDVKARRAAIIQNVQHLKDKKAIIIDMRPNSGGDPAAVQLLCSLFMEKEHQPLNRLDWRASEKIESDRFETLSYDELPLDLRLTKPLLYILGGPNTFSAGEEFMNDMKVYKKATIVGTKTGGGANPGGRHNVNDLFEIFIPSGQAVNLVNGGNWEGVGIIPDHKTEEERALRTAIELFRASQKVRHE